MASPEFPQLLWLYTTIPALWIGASVANPSNQITTSTTASAITVEYERENALIVALIEKIDGVAGGSARIARTRIPVWTIENYRRLGATNPQLLEAFPTLRDVDLDAADAYVLQNRAEIERDIAANEAS